MMRKLYSEQVRAGISGMPLFLLCGLLALAVGLHELSVTSLPVGSSHNLNVATIIDLYLGVAGLGSRPLKI